MAAASDTLRLLTALEHLRPDQNYLLGLPVNQETGVEHLTPLLAAFLCNVNSTIEPLEVQGQVNSLEGSVREFFKELTQAPRFARSHVSVSETEGIRFGLATAVNRMPNAPVYLSDQAKCGLPGAVLALGAELVTIGTRLDGTMDAVELRRAVAAGTARRPDSGAIILAICGNAETGAVDDISELRLAASAAGRVYVHTDATLGGMVAGHAPSGPSWSFQHGADSVSISAHRVLGSTPFS